MTSSEDRATWRDYDKAKERKEELTGKQQLMRETVCSGAWAMNEGRTDDRVFHFSEEINRSTTEENNNLKIIFFHTGCC